MNVSGPTSPPPRIPAVAAPIERRPQAPAGPSANDRPAAADATLWELLTPEEREFFAQQTSLGPVTYRSGGESLETTPAPLGRRIDVRG